MLADLGKLFLKNLHKLDNAAFFMFGQLMGVCLFHEIVLEEISSVHVESLFSTGPIAEGFKSLKVPNFESIVFICYV